MPGGGEADQVLGVRRAPDDDPAGAGEVPQYGVLDQRAQLGRQRGVADQRAQLGAQPVDLTAERERHLQLADGLLDRRRRLQELLLQRERQRDPARDDDLLLDHPQRGLRQLALVGASCLRDAGRGTRADAAAAGAVPVEAKPVRRSVPQYGGQLAKVRGLGAEPVRVARPQLLQRKDLRGGQVGLADVDLRDRPRRAGVDRVRPGDLAGPQAPRRPGPRSLRPRRRPAWARSASAPCWIAFGMPQPAARTFVCDSGVVCRALISPETRGMSSGIRSITRMSCQRTGSVVVRYASSELKTRSRPVVVPGLSGTYGAVEYSSCARIRGMPSARKLSCRWFAGLSSTGTASSTSVANRPVERAQQFGAHRVDLDGLQREEQTAVLRRGRAARACRAGTGGRGAVDGVVERVEVAGQFGPGHAEDPLGDVLDVQHPLGAVDQVHGRRLLIEHELHVRVARRRWWRGP